MENFLLNKKNKDKLIGGLITIGVLILTFVVKEYFKEEDPSIPLSSINNDSSKQSIKQFNQTNNAPTVNENINGNKIVNNFDGLKKIANPNIKDNSFSNNAQIGDHNAQNNNSLRVINGNNYGINGDVNLDIPIPTYSIKLDTLNLQIKDYYHSKLHFEINSKIPINSLKILIKGKTFYQMYSYPIKIEGMYTLGNGKNDWGIYNIINVAYNGMYEISIDSKEIELFDTIVFVDSHRNNIFYTPL